MTLERAAQNTVVRAVPQQEVSASDSDSASAPEFINNSTGNIDELQTVPITEENKARRTSSAAGTRPSPTPRVKMAKQIREAEMFSLRLLKAGKLVPSHDIDQVNGWRCRSILGLAGSGGLGQTLKLKRRHSVRGCAGVRVMTKGLLVIPRKTARGSRMIK